MPTTPEFKKAEEDVQTATRRLLGIRGRRRVDHFHRELGMLMWEKCGMARNEAGLREALKRIPPLREEFWENVNVLGRRGGAEPVARKGRPGRGLLGIRRAAVLRRAEPPGIVRRPFPRGIPDPGRRGEAGRRAISPTSRAWEYVGENSPPHCTRSRWSSRPCISQPGVTNERVWTSQTKFQLRVWRQKNGQTPGGFAEYEARDIPADASFLEMLDIVNEGADRAERGAHRL